jgi:UDP-glucose 4-epimerase
MGKGIDNFMARYLRRPLVQTVLGYDPLWQALHIEDALSAIEVALDKELPGVFNYAAPGVLPLSTIIQLLGGQRLPTPYSLFRTQMAALRLGQLAGFPPEHLDYFRYGCLGDCIRAFKIAGLRPKYTLQDTLAAVEQSAVEWMEDRQ